MLRFILLISINVLALAALLLAIDVRVNISPSYPVGVYRQVDTHWQKRDLVISCLPEAIAQWGLERGYLVRSTQCRGHIPVIKQVIALSGDWVSTDQQLAVNGSLIPNTQIHTHDTRGRTLPKTSGGLTAVNQVWLVSNHVAGSFDSRYFGAIDQALVQGKLEPLWTL